LFRQPTTDREIFFESRERRFQLALRLQDPANPTQRCPEALLPTGIALILLRHTTTA